VVSLVRPTQPVETLVSSPAVVGITAISDRKHLLARKGGNTETGRCCRAVLVVLVLFSARSAR
jgi:hypothetical protein